MVKHQLTIIWSITLFPRFSADSSEWGTNFPDANGDSQSPINISSNDTEYDSVIHDRALNFNYAICRETDICNNGHALVVSLKYKLCKYNQSIIDRFKFDNIWMIATRFK